MRKISKIETIASAFLSDPNVSSKILNKRREVCGSCDLNSDNVPDKNLGLVEKVRKKTKKPFCTACGCQIFEKTTRGTEECGAVSKNLEPRWNRVIVRTINRYDLDLYSLSPDIINIDLSDDGSHYVINTGQVSVENNLSFSFLLRGKPNLDIDIFHFKPSCGSCTNFEINKTKNNTYKVDIELNLKSILDSEFSKPIYLSYNVNGTVKKSVIKIIGKTK